MAGFVGADPNPVAAQGRSSYAATRNINPAQFHNAFITPSAQQTIAAEYSKLPDFDPRAVPAYKAMREETGRQFDHMTKPVAKGGMGMSVGVTKHDPYGANDTDKVFHEAGRDVANRHINVLSSAQTGGHPFFSNDENDMFRAVHDTFGHLAVGRGVDRHGEEAAYQSHSSMYSPLARQAMATETRGQNAAFVANREFPTQKVALLPHHMLSPGFATQGGAEERSRAMLQAQQFSRNQGIGR